MRKSRLLAGFFSVLAIQNCTQYGMNWPFNLSLYLSNLSHFLKVISEQHVMMIKRIS